MDKETKKNNLPDDVVEMVIFKIKESVERSSGQSSTQCPMCNSQGEIDEEKSDTIYIDSDGLHRVH